MSKRLISNYEMNKVEKFVPLLLGLIAFLCLWLYLDHTQRFLFYYREQQQLFVYSTSFIYNRYVTFGGLSLFLSQFLLQFFSAKLVGSFVTALLGALTAFFLWKVLKKINPAVYMFPLSFVPVISQLNALYDYYYSYQCFIAFFVVVCCLFVYVSVADKLRWQYRVILSVVMSAFIYLLIGSIGGLFAFSVLLYDVLRRNQKCYMQIIPVAVVLSLGFFLIVSGKVQSARLAFLNDAYYEPLLKPSMKINSSWLMMLGLFPVYYIMRFVPRFKPMMNVLLSVVLFGGVCWYSTYLAKGNKQSIYAMIELQHYVAAGQWDALLQSERSRNSNFLTMNMTNLALSHKGMLLTEHLFSFPQNGSSSLVVQGEIGEKIPDLAVILSHIYYQMGNVAAAQNKAFDSSVGIRFGNPTMLKMLVKTNLIMGAYPVAEKYLSVLKKTWRYRKWAKEQCRFLYDDEAVEKDPELGLKRLDLPQTDQFVYEYGAYADMVHVLETGTHDLAVRDYAIAFLLLAKDTGNINQFTEQFYATDIMKEVPTLLQEALIAVNEADMDYCRTHGVAEKTIERYNLFKRKFIEARNAGRDPKSALRREYGRCYWYYYLFQTINER